MRVWLGLIARMAVAAGLGAGCGDVGNATAVSGGTTGAGGGPDSGGGPDAGGSDSSGLSCEIAQALAVCVGCHAHPPINGAIGSLVTYADLTSPAPTDATRTMVEMAVTRMQDASEPMPPKPLAPATALQIQTLSNWIAAGTPRGMCSAPPGEPTFQGQPSCPGNDYVKGGDDNGAAMYPGRACIWCHSIGGNEPDKAPILAGTLFATGRVLDDCRPPATLDLTNAEVIIHDANGAQVLGVLGDGNFLSYSLSPPYSAKVRYMGKERAMVASQTSGDCNACHTASGTNGAPGRIALPQ